MNGAGRTLVRTGKVLVILLAAVLCISWVGWVFIGSTTILAAPLSPVLATLTEHRALFIGMRWALWLLIFCYWSRIGRRFAPGNSDSAQQWRKAWEQRRVRFLLPIVLVETLILLSGGGVSAWA